MRRFPFFALIALIAIFLCALSTFCLATPDTPQKKFRVLYVDGGSYFEFQRCFLGFALGLQELGLINNGNVVIPQDTESTEKMWTWMQEHAGSQKIEFLKDGYYTGAYDADKLLHICKAIQKRLQEKNDVDLILSFGTRASKEIIKLDTSVPIIVCAVSDPLAAKIVPSIADSGKDNLVAIIKPDTNKESIRIFHDIFHFKKLGIAYEDTENGKDIVGLGAIESITKELNVELLHCKKKFDSHKNDRDLSTCYQDLVDRGVEAILLTRTITLTEKNAKRHLNPIIRAFIPTFSQAGSNDVRLGALMSFAQSKITNEGIYIAKLCMHIMEGEKPRSLPQQLKSPSALAINIRTATFIGWNPSIDVLTSADEFYYNHDSKEFSFSIP